MSALVTPCHGMPLAINSEWDDNPYMIHCTEPGCPNYWDHDGTVIYWQAPA